MCWSTEQKLVNSIFYVNINIFHNADLLAATYNNVARIKCHTSMSFTGSLCIQGPRSVDLASLAHLAAIGLCLMDVRKCWLWGRKPEIFTKSTYAGELCTSLLEPVHSQLNGILDFDIISNFNFHFQFQFPFPFSVSISWFSICPHTCYVAKPAMRR